MWKDLAKSLKSAIMEESEEDKAPPRQAQADAQRMHQEVLDRRMSPIEIPRPANLQPGEINQEMVDILRKQTYLQPTALTALLAASEQLVDIIPDPTMRIKAAHKTSNAGRRPQEVIDAVDIHLNLLAQEEARFTEAVQAKSEAEIGGLRAAAKEAFAAVEEKKRLIAEMQAKIVELEGSLYGDTAAAQGLQNDALTRQAEFDQSANEFKDAANVIRSELAEQKSIITSTLS